MHRGLVLGLLITIAFLATGGPAVRAEGPDLARAHASLARGAIAEAITLYTELLQEGSLTGQPLAIAYRERGIAQQKAGFARHAIADFTNALWLDVLPSQLKADTYLGRAVAYLELGQLDRADQDFVQAINNDRGLAEGYFGRGTVKRLEGRPREALTHYDRALKLGHARPALVHLGRGLAFESLGTHDAALEAYKQAAALEPGLEIVRRKLADYGEPLPIATGENTPRADLSALAIGVADAGHIVFASPDNSGPTGALGPADEGGIAVMADTAASGGEAMPASPETPADPRGDGPAKAPALRPGSDGPLAPDKRAKPLPQQPASDKREGAGLTPVDGGQTGISSATDPTAENAVRAAGLGADLSRASARYLLQFAAYNSKDGADNGLESLSARFHELLGGTPLFIERAAIPGKGTIFRLRAGPFESEGVAQATCRALIAQGQDCLLVPQAQTLQN